LIAASYRLAVFSVLGRMLPQISAEVRELFVGTVRLGIEITVVLHQAQRLNDIKRAHPARWPLVIGKVDW
jgi:hypothetical protein